MSWVWDIWICLENWVCTAEEVRGGGPEVNMVVGRVTYASAALCSLAIAVMARTIIVFIFYFIFCFWHPLSYCDFKELFIFVKDSMLKELPNISPNEPFIFSLWEDSDNTSHDSTPFGPGVNIASSLSSCNNSVVSSPEVHDKLPNDSDTDDQSSNKQQSQPKMKKKRIRTNRRLYPFPRIVKRDIRRMYPAMLANVMNSGDLSFLSSFLSEFSTKKCKFIDYFPGSDEIQFGWNRSFEGVPSIMQYFSSFWNDITQSFIPDFHIKVRWAEVKQFLNQEHSELKCGLTFSGTPIFDLSLLIQQFFGKSEMIPMVNFNLNKKRKLTPVDYKHTQTLYLTPDMDAYLDTPNGDNIDLPLLTSEQGAQMMATFQRIFQSSSFFAISGQSFLQSFVPSSTKKSICYNGLVTFKLDGKCQIRSLEFGPEVHQTTTNLLTNSDNVSLKKQCIDFTANVNNSDFLPENSSFYDLSCTQMMSSNNNASQSYSLLMEDCLNFLDSMIDPSFCMTIPV